MTDDAGKANPHEEPCLACGEETAVGSVFFSDRHPAESKDGTHGYLCSECVQRIRAKGHHVGMSEGRLVEGSVMGLTGGWF
jgi:hypothetical protein